MSKITGKPMGEFLRRVSYWCSGPQMLAFVPALCLAAFWSGGEGALVAVSLAVPLLVVLVNPSALNARAATARKSRGFVDRDDFDAIMTTLQHEAPQSGKSSAVFLLELDEYGALVERHGQTAAEAVWGRIAERLEGMLRDNDAITKLGDQRFGVCLGAVNHLDLENCIELSGRMQSSVEEPVSLDGTAIYMSAAIGFCMLSRAPGSGAHNWFGAAETALMEARRRGPTTIRSYSTEMRKQTAARLSLREDAKSALEDGQVQPWFQPQISTDTGHVTGFEALARWTHPDRGMISPPEFLPAFEEAGLLDRLGEVMLYHTLTALKAWDATGVVVPTVGVNFSGEELSNPQLVDRIKWELDRFDIAPERLAVEILETVVSSAPGDVVSRNVRALGDLGCQIDLDDFGTGNASIAAIRRFNVSRIKIDRSFVMKSDRDSDQRRMIAAILTMAERLDIETLAEGVETVGEHALLAQLGCNHVQGFGIGRPMPFDKTIDWIHSHEAKLDRSIALPGKKANDR